jgi:hypothetical protein
MPKSPKPTTIPATTATTNAALFYSTIVARLGSVAVGVVVASVIPITTESVEATVGKVEVGVEVPRSMFIGISMP